MKVLYHECTDENGAHLPVEFVDGNGFMWVVPFGEPVEFENAFMADKILEHMRYMGLVEVKFTKSRTGITYDMEDAKKRAAATLLIAEKQCYNHYVQTQLETRVQKNYPPLPPTGRALSCIIKHRVNLLAYGLRPVGWEPPYQMEGGFVDPQIKQTGAPNSSVSNGNLDDRMRALEQLILSQQALINELKSAKGVSGGGRKSANLPPPAAVDILAADATPPPASKVNLSEGSDDTYESIRL